VLSTGDVFPTTLLHGFRSIGQDEAEIISTNTPANFLSVKAADGRHSIVSYLVNRK
jgi:hypothetical protein